MEKFQPKNKNFDNEKIVISIRMDTNKINKIDKIATKINISRNEFINQCVEYALDNIDFKYDNKKDSKKETD